MSRARTDSSASGATVCAAIGPAVCASIGSAVCASIGPAVATTDGPAIGAAVCSAITDAGDPVGAAVRRALEILDTLARTLC